MALLLGVDAGGTYTDAVIVDDARAPGPSQVVAWSKCETTHGDLNVGVSQAMRQVIESSGVSGAQVDLVAVSTTLATNALVEGHAQPVALVSVGFSLADLQRIGLDEHVPAHLQLVFDGGHDAHGNERSALDIDAIGRRFESIVDQVSACAVVAQFSVRNPAHERKVRDALAAAHSIPVTCSHELTARLDGPRRAVTSVLNAGLIGVIGELNSAVQRSMSHLAIAAPLMVVRGDGTLVSAAFARDRPIETVLSGPAASVIGGLHLAAEPTCLVIDIGGTTSDLAVVHNGRPRIATEGATVGGHRTMVEAVDMATIGLGGDSEVRVDSRADGGPLMIGPERAIAVGRLAARWPDLHDVLDRQLAAQVGQRGHGRFVVLEREAATDSLDQRERSMLDALSTGPVAESAVAFNSADVAVLTRLRSRGLVRVATMTPTDAIAHTQHIDGVDSSASRKVATLLARQQGPDGSAVASDSNELAEAVVEQMVSLQATFMLKSALVADGVNKVDDDNPLLQSALASAGPTAHVSIELLNPVIALGASAATYFPMVGDRIKADVRVPAHAGVANAVGAVVGQVRVRETAVVTQPTRGQFRVHLDDQPGFGTEEWARDHARIVLSERLRRAADRAGAANPVLHESWDVTRATIDGREVFVEATFTLEATGRPRL